MAQGKCNTSILKNIFFTLEDVEQQFQHVYAMLNNVLLFLSMK